MCSRYADDCERIPVPMHSLPYIRHMPSDAATRRGLMFVGLIAVWFELLGCVYWAIQAGLLTPLTFVRHRLSPLAAFTSGAYLFHRARW